MNEKGESTLKILIEKLKYFNYSDITIKMYSFYVKQFIYSQNKSFLHLNSDDYSTYLLNYKYTSISQQNQVINSLKFLYEKVLNKKYNKVCFERPRSEKKLPTPIDSKFLVCQIEKIENIKHKAIISLAFSVGLRVSEIINLKISDIDSKRMLIKIVQSKGKKDRYVPLSEGMLGLLRSYIKKCRPKEYLFNGQNSINYTPTSCNALVKKYIGKQYHFHQLRHSCFTYLLESGVDLRIIQKIAGHSSSKTTEIYTHVSNHTLSKINLPL